MRSAFESKKHGALVGEGRGAKRLLFFEDGDIVGVRSNLVEDRLGAIMVREERISQSQLDEATEFIRSGRKLGQILVELGYLKGGEIERYVRIQILDVARDLLMASSDRLIFSEEVPVAAVTLSPVSVGDVFLHAVRGFADVGIYRKNVLIDDYILEQTLDALAIASGMKLTNEEASVLDLVDGTNTVGGILEASRLGEDETVRFLIALHEAGVVTLEERKTDEAPAPGPRPTPETASVDPFDKELTRFYSEIQCRNHWQVLGLSRGAAYTEIDHAYQELFHKFDPEKYEHIPDQEFQEKLSFVRARVKEAYITLSSQSSSNVYEKLDEHETQYQETRQQWEVIASAQTEPEKWERPKDKEEAVRLFKRAKRALKEQDFWNAVELCRLSIELDEENHPERYHLLGCALSENPRWRRDAEQNFEIAHKLEPWEPRYLVSLGKLYAKGGLYERAERVYAQVRTIDPDFPIPEIEKDDGKGPTKSKKAG